MSVARTCVRSVDVARPDETAQAAAQRMLSRNVGSLVVVNSKREPVGILTDRDLVIRVLAAGQDGAQVTVGEVMTQHVTTVIEETPIEDALRLMRVHACRRLPVVDGDGHLAGVVCLDDILDLLSHEFREIGRLLVEETPASLVGNWAPSVE